MHSVRLSAKAKEDVMFWEKHNQIVFKTLMRILNDIASHPFKGRNKPEKLKYQGANIWSRRINRKDRIVYEVSSNKVIFVIRCRGHYDD